MALGRLRSMLVVAGVLLALASMVGVASAAGGSAPGGPPVVKGKTLNKPPTGPVVSGATLRNAPATSIAGDSAALPFTGGDVVLFLGIGLVTFAAGLTMFRRSRPKMVTS
jgi:hypothetical protein